LKFWCENEGSDHPRGILSRFDVPFFSCVCSISSSLAAVLLRAIIVILQMNCLWNAVLAIALLKSVAADVVYFPTPPRSSDPNITVEHLVFSTERQVLLA
jgi:hypothetical protein